MPSRGRGIEGAAIVDCLPRWGAGEGVCQCFLWPRLWGDWSDVFSTTPNHGGSEETTLWWQGFSSLGGSIFSPTGDASGTFCWELPTDDRCASPGTAPAGSFRDSGIPSLVPWPGTGAQGLRAQGGGHLHVSPLIQVVRAGAVPPGLPHTVVLLPALTVSAPEPDGSQPKRQKKKKSAEEKDAERANKECWPCHQLGH